MRRPTSRSLASSTHRYLLAFRSYEGCSEETEVHVAHSTEGDQIRRCWHPAGHWLSNVPDGYQIVTVSTSIKDNITVKWKRKSTLRNIDVRNAGVGRHYQGSGSQFSATGLRTGWSLSTSPPLD